MRKAAVAATSLPENISPMFAAITSSTRARCTSASEGNVTHRGNWLGTGTTTTRWPAPRPTVASSSAATCNCRLGNSGPGDKSWMLSGVRSGSISRAK